MYFNTFKKAAAYNLLSRPGALGNLDELQEFLAQNKHTTITDSQNHNSGFINPMNDKERDELFVKVDQFIYVAFQSDERKVEKETVDAKVAAAVEKIQSEGREVTKQLQNSLHDQYYTELLPFQKIKTKVTQGYFDLSRNLIVIDESSTNAAEKLIHALRKAFGGLRTTIARVKNKPCNELSEWLTTGETPEQIFFDQEGKTRAITVAEKDVTPVKITINGCGPNDGSMQEALSSMLITYSDLCIREQKDDNSEEPKNYFFGLNSKPDNKKLQPDLILSALHLGLWKCSYDEDVNAALFENAKILGFILDKLFAAFGGCITDDLEQPESEVKVDDNGVVWCSELVKAGQESPSDIDPLYEQVKEHVAESRKASVSNIQRQFKIGYNRAATIMEQLENLGVVSAPGFNSGHRTVLIAPLEAN